MRIPCIAPKQANPLSRGVVALGNMEDFRHVQ
jgi:hypothetical protein